MASISAGVTDVSTGPTGVINCNADLQPKLDNSKHPMNQNHILYIIFGTYMFCPH